jgi:hypothetical protein
MVSIFTVQMIPGIMLGIEWQHENSFFVIDLFIIRLVFDYGSIENEETKA